MTGTDKEKAGLLCKCTAHLDDVQESYFEHLRFALYICGQLLKAASAVVVHALVPALFTRTASATLFSLCGEIERRAAASAARKEQARQSSAPHD
jgi:hypothetical protein